jgi:hypothetical protein
MFDQLLSLARTERKTEAQAIRRDHGYGMETVWNDPERNRRLAWAPAPHLTLFLRAKQGRNREIATEPT